MWALIAVLDRWPTGAGTLVTLAAFITLTAGMIAALVRAHPRRVDLVSSRDDSAGSASADIGRHILTTCLVAP